VKQEQLIIKVMAIQSCNKAVLAVVFATAILAVVYAKADWAVVLATAVLSVALTTADLADAFQQRICSNP
jgi:hypothetical protein